MIEDKVVLKIVYCARVSLIKQIFSFLIAPTFTYSDDYSLLKNV